VVKKSASEPAPAEPPLAKSSASVQPTPVQSKPNIPTTIRTPEVSSQSPLVNTSAAIIGTVLNPPAQTEKLKEVPKVTLPQQRLPFLRAFGARPVLSAQKKKIPNVKVKIRHRTEDPDPELLKVELNKNVREVVNHISPDNKSNNMFVMDLNFSPLLDFLNNPSLHHHLVDFMRSLKKMGLVEPLHFPEMGDVKLILKLYEAAKIAGIEKIGLSLNDINLLQNPKNKEFLQEFEALKKLSPDELLKNFLENGNVLGSSSPAPAPDYEYRPRP